MEPQRVVIEYQHRGYTPLGDDPLEAYLVDAQVTHSDLDSLAATSGTLQDVRETLAGAGLVKKGVHPLEDRCNGRFAFAWREVWAAEVASSSPAPLRGGYLSPEAAKAVAEAAGREAAQRAAWERGPYLVGDRLVIPSPRFHRQAAAFWRSNGFEFTGGTWERDTTAPHNGKRYSAAAWLKAARRKFGEFWPKWSEVNG